MLGRSGTLIAFVLGIGLMGGPVAAATWAIPEPEVIDARATVARMADWAVRSGDNQNLPFAIIDKAAARVFVYSPDGAFLGSTPALLGLTPGDDSTPGVGDRELSDIPPEDRTTPAGRFVGFYGPAEGKHEDVLWVDFATAISLHPVVTTNAAERRAERLESETIDDNRISFGCINVPTAFYADVVQPTFTGTRGVFYVLPEERTMAEVFPSFSVETQFASRDAQPVRTTLSEPHRPSEWW